jgi:hypothetical protein
MPKEPKIKARLKQLLYQVGHYWIREDNASMYLHNTDDFKELEQIVKSLRKENNQMRNLNAELLNRLIDATNDCISEVIQTLDKERKRLLFPVAEFKCAKTNNPSKFGKEFCCLVFNGHFNEYSYKTFQHTDHWCKPDDFEVIAFTETEPSQIVDALNKEK